MIVLVVVEGLAVALLALLVAGLLRSHAEILRSLHRLEAGEGHERPEARVGPGVMAPRAEPGSVYDVAGRTPFEESVSVAVAGSRVDTLLAFLSAGCSSCARIWQALAGPHLGLPDRTRVVVVTLGPGEESPARLRRLAPPGVPVVMSSEAWEDYRVPGAPYFVLVDGEHSAVRGEGSASSWAEVVSLLGDAAGDGGSRSRDRESRVDRELAAAGILPGDPRLHHPPADGRGA